MCMCGVYVCVCVDFTWNNSITCNSPWEKQKQWNLQTYIDSKLITYKMFTVGYMLTAMQDKIFVVSGHMHFVVTGSPKQTYQQ